MQCGFIADLRNLSMMLSRAVLCYVMLCCLRWSAVMQCRWGI
jgi:hypothetical protein